jgi:hypothetical protein
MKTRVQYEASDIDFKNNDAHGAIAAALLLGVMSMFGQKDKMSLQDGIPVNSEAIMKEAVAAALTALEGCGYAVTKVETVPAVFREGFREGNPN